MHEIVLQDALKSCLAKSSIMGEDVLMAVIKVSYNGMLDVSSVACQRSPLKLVAAFPSCLQLTIRMHERS